MDATHPFVAQAFCFSLILFGSFFLLNLILVVIVKVFMNMYAEEAQKQLEIEQE